MDKAADDVAAINEFIEEVPVHELAWNEENPIVAVGKCVADQPYEA